MTAAASSSSTTCNGVVYPNTNSIPLTSDQKIDVSSTTGRNDDASSSSCSINNNHHHKTIYLIRHAESEENRRLGSLKDACKSIMNLSVPKSTDVNAAFELLNVKEQIDSCISDVGKIQIERMGKKLKEVNFLTNNHIEVVVHSPLIRARETSLGMLGCIGGTNPTTITKPECTQIKVIESDLLIEKTPTEWINIINSSSYVNRLLALEKWLHEIPETTIVLVGHSQFCKSLLKLNYKFNNCDVWKVRYNGIASNHSEKWQNLSLLYKCDDEITTTQPTTETTEKKL